MRGPLPAPPSRNLSATGAVAAVAPPTELPKDDYDLGYGYVLRKDYALAEDSLPRLPEKISRPTGAPPMRNSGSAKACSSASVTTPPPKPSSIVSTKHGSHAKAPEALLRLAQSLAAMKQKEMACATLAEVGRKYPKASAGVKQGVEREQKRVHC